MILYRTATSFDRTSSLLLCLCISVPVSIVSLEEFSLNYCHKHALTLKDEMILVISSVSNRMKHCLFLAKILGTEETHFTWPGNYADGMDFVLLRAVGVKMSQKLSSFRWSLQQHTHLRYCSHSSSLVVI